MFSRVGLRAAERVGYHFEPLYRSYERDPELYWLDSPRVAVSFYGYVVVSWLIFGTAYHVSDGQKLTEFSATELLVPANALSFATANATQILLLAVPATLIGLILLFTHTNVAPRGTPLTGLSTFGVSLCLPVCFLVGAFIVTKSPEVTVVTNYLFIVAISQSVLLTGLYAAFSSPFYPENRLESLPARYRPWYLWTYVSNWWQWARLITSLMIAFGITLILAIITTRPGGLIRIFVPISVHLTVGAFYGCLFVVVKKRAVDARLQTELFVQRLDSLSDVSPDRTHPDQSVLRD